MRFFLRDVALRLVPKIYQDAVGHPASVGDYFELAWLTCSLAMIGGALGAALEPDEAVREAAYAQHPHETTDLNDAA